MARLPSAILFACSHNSVRSPMAEWWLKHFHGDRIFVDSVGVREGEVDPFAVAAMHELGVDISHHNAKTFDNLPDDSFDLVVTLSPEAHHRAIEMTRTAAVEVEYWRTFDPTIVEGTRDQRLAAYMDVARTLRDRILDRFPVASAAGGG